MMTSSISLSFALPTAVAVSGAASGLGHAVCALLVAAGVTTVGVDRAPALASLGSAAAYHHVQGDVTSVETWDAAAKALHASGDGPLGLVTAAAILDVGTVLGASRQDMLRTFDVNVIGTALAFKAVLPLMIAHGAGSIVAVASVDATFAEQQLAVYAASKAAVRQLARTVAMDHARQGVRVNVLSPGPMMAGLFKRHLESAADSAAFLATRSARQPGGRILEAEEVARTALFLLSSGASALNGSDVIADGGLTTSFDFRTGAEGASV
jgi:NAD(P)-dependent dehydrogenase (short-subunit alcohol dehydrogenase family)